MPHLPDPQPIPLLIQETPMGKTTETHSSRSEWPVEQQVNDVLNVPNHHHIVTDSSGKSGSGSGRSEHEAKSNAWDDFKKK